MTAVILCAMALIDGALSGFRSWSGRDGRIVKRDHRIRSSLQGAAMAVLALGLIAMAALIATNSTALGYGDLVAAGRRMVWVYVPFCVAVACGFLAYFSRKPDVQAFGTAMVFGPATLARPIVIIGGAVSAAWGNGYSIAIVALIAAATMLSVEPILSLHWRRSLQGHPFA